MIARAWSWPIRLADRLQGDRKGVSAMEFTLVAPAFMMLTMGIFDVGQMGYGYAVLNGAVQKAARDSALETAKIATLDDRVKAQVSPIFPSAEFDSSRTSYNDFSDIGRPERWNDANNDSTCNNSEIYVDENGNGSWDQDIGQTGNGGANDVVVYRFTVTYKSVFAIPFLPDQWNTRELTATAIRKNQPFATQRGVGATSGTCS